MKNLIKNKKHQKIFLGIAATLGLVIGAGLLFAAKGGNFLFTKKAKTFYLADVNSELNEKTVTVETKKVSLETITQGISASGVTEPLNKVKVSPKITAKVVAVYFKEGDWVEAGKTMIQLEKDQTLLTAYDNALTNLINTRAAAKQDIQAAEVAVESAKVALANAKKALENTQLSSEQAIDDAYVNALNIARNAVLVGTSAIVTATELQYKYFTLGGQTAARIAEKKSKAVELLLGEPNTALWAPQFIISLDGGVKKEVEEATLNFSRKKVDQILEDIIPALQAVKDLLAEVRAGLNEKHMALDSEKSAVDNARSAVESSLEALFTAKQGILDAKLRKTTSIDTAQSSYESAKKQLEAAQANLLSVKKRAELQIAAAQAQLDSIKAQLDNTVIKAPISGIVSQKYIEVGEMAIAGNPVAEIVDTREIEIKVALTEFDIGKVFVGQQAEVILPAYPNKKFIGKVYYVSPVADPVSKKFPVKIRLKNPNGEIKAGMVAEVKIITKRQKNVLVIPKSAVFKEGEIEKVYVVENSRVKIKNVKTEPIDENRLKVLEGLSEGEEIIVNGNYDLKEGQLVTVKNQ